MLNVSIVLYHHTPEMILPLVERIKEAELFNELYLVDNSTHENKAFLDLSNNYIFNNNNVGYGRGHNIALRKSIASNTPYHLVINPDIELNNGKQLDQMIAYLEQHKEVGLLMPKVIYPNGDTQYLCKLLPKPSNLLFRRFFPSKWSQKANEKFELRFSGYDKVMNVPYLSGAFMLLRTSVLQELGLFDERYFMYPEDIDLSRRIHQKYKTLYYPFETVIHHHEQASYKNLKMLCIHSWNIAKYFSKWGWIRDDERKMINQKTIQEIIAFDTNPVKTTI